MQQIDLLQAKSDIQELAARYGHYCDHPGWDGVLDLYTDDGVFDAATVYGQVWSGKDELRNFYENAPGAVAHHPTALFTDLGEDGTAHTLCKFIVFFHRQVFSVDYEWDLVKVGDAWKIRKQTILVVGKAKLGAEQAAEQAKV
jgi:hypothetical protein